MLRNEYSLTEKVYQNLRSDILSGTFRDREELRETALAKTYGVSRTPVREAIRQLALEGLVDTIPNRGAYVHNIHGKDVKDVYAIRSLLEGLAARWAVENITDEQIEAMEEVLYMSEYYRKKELWEQVYVCDNKFHDLMPLREAIFWNICSGLFTSMFSRFESLRYRMKNGRKALLRSMRPYWKP